MNEMPRLWKKKLPSLSWVNNRVVCHREKVIMMPRLTVSTTLTALAVLCASGCANIAQVNPWEKGMLAKPAMKFDSDPLENRYTEHIYASKENSAGGAGVGGGGCGCN
jgi:hypothetical protein